ncbi:hypothetical protein MIND_00683200 [Mycena indigotica]|uniref:Uncharacterized protein n=1 Tax=Mycena indigotica TaxID=2126181 RepID=A0A8H6W159_9AGAR|nr:uncharacterized protein MIND_00683200 [Mycena indigotica]KAF7301187.1 hypothetical protein MIND_00683200 [Mycena indigotica]
MVLPHSGTNIIVPLVNVFLTLQLIGACGLVAILLTAIISKRVKRNATWYNFIATWILSCLSYTFVFIIGQQYTPNFGPCLVQAGAIYGAPVVTSCATLAFAVDMFLGVRATAIQKPSQRRRYLTISLVVLPFAIWLGFVLPLWVFGAQNPTEVRIGPNGTYCDFESNIPSKVSSAISVVSTFSLLLIEGYIATRLIKNRNLLKDRQLVRMAVRVILFSLLGALSLGIGVAYVLYSIPGSSFDVIMSTLPVGGCLIFGTQADLLRVWMFWRHPAATPAIPKGTESTQSMVSKQYGS